jgi:hypothetical protein
MAVQRPSMMLDAFGIKGMERFRQGADFTESDKI